MSILESITQAEMQADQQKKEALAAARETIRKAEQEALQLVSAEVESARAKAAEQERLAQQRADQEAAVLVAKGEDEGDALRKSAIEKLPAAIDAITKKVVS